MKAKDLLWLFVVAGTFPVVILVCVITGNGSILRSGFAKRHRSKRQRRALYQPGATPQEKSRAAGASALPKAGTKAEPERLNCLPSPRHDPHSRKPAHRKSPKSCQAPKPSNSNKTKIKIAAH